MNPYLSIIVPVYKVEPYLHQCIDSILAQTFNDFELILVDDGSPDKCPHICDEYVEKDKRIKVIHKNNGGLVSARIAGLKAADGRYIGYVDSDDWIEKDMYKQLCEASQLYRSDIVICDVIHSYQNKEIRGIQMIEPGLYDKNDMKRLIYPCMLYQGSFYKFGIYPALWNKIFRKELLEKNQYNVNEIIRLGEDTACTYPCLLDAGSIYVLNKKYLYHYRQIESSMTSNYDEKFFDRILLLFKLLKKMNKEKAVFDLTPQLNYYLTYLMILGLHNENSIYNKKSSYEKRKFIKDILVNNYINDAVNNISLKGFPLKSKLYIWLLQRKQINILFMIMFVWTRIRKIISR